MIKGMTGFGQAQMSSGKVRALVEIKSVNQRYLDVNYYLPVGFASIEEKIRQIIQRVLERGRVTISIKILQAQTPDAILNKDVARKHLANINRLKKEFGFKGELSLVDLVQLPGVLEFREAMVDPEDIWPALERSLLKALQGLIGMRKREGRSLSGDVSDKLRRMSLQIKKIEEGAKNVLETKKAALPEDEFRAFQRGSDVNEEITRLKHYIEEIKLLLKSSVSVGKKMDFIAQEMQRETNTIGAKLQDKEVSSAVIALKSKIEKIREQAQNIE